MRLIDADAYKAEMKTRHDACAEWLDEAAADGNEEQYVRAEQALAMFIEAMLTLNKMPTIEAVPLGDYKSMEHTVYKLAGALRRPQHINCPECGKGYYILDNRIIGELPQKTGNISRAILLDQIYAQFPADNKTATRIIEIIESLPRES